MHRQKKLIITSGLFIAVTTILAILTSSFYKVSDQQNDATPTPSSATATPTQHTSAPQRMTMEGEIVCLPKKNTGDIQTMECQLGLLGNDGNYYILDTNLISQTPPQYDTGDRISASGTVTPIEFLSTDKWQQYQVKGIFSVTDSFKKL